MVPEMILPSQQSVKSFINHQISDIHSDSSNTTQTIDSPILVPPTFSKFSEVSQSEVLKVVKNLPKDLSHFPVPSCLLLVHF